MEFEKWWCSCWKTSLRDWVFFQRVWVRCAWAAVCRASCSLLWPAVFGGGTCRCPCRAQSSWWCCSFLPYNVVMFQKRSYYSEVPSNDRAETFCAVKRGRICNVHLNRALCSVFHYHWFEHRCDTEVIFTLQCQTPLLLLDKRNDAVIVCDFSRQNLKLMGEGGSLAMWFLIICSGSVLFILSPAPFWDFTEICLKKHLQFLWIPTDCLIQVSEYSEQYWLIVCP